MMSEARRRAYNRQRNTETVILLIGFLIVAAIISIVATAADEPAENAAEITVSAAETQQIETAETVAEHAETAAETAETVAEHAETAAETAETAADYNVDNVEDTGEESTDVNKAADEGGQTADQPPESIKRTGYAVSVCGVECEYADYLYYSLALFGRQDFYKYALAQMFQESGFNPAAVGPDGHDIGLYQFRIEYWDEYAAAAGFSGADIWDPYAQIAVYCWHVDDRAARSADLYTTISDHYTGGKGYAPEYVSAVLQWVGQEE